MATKRDTKDIPKTVSAMVVIAAVLLLLFIWPYLGVVLFSILIAFLFNPVYRFILKKTKRNALAITGTLVTAALTAIIPITVILLVTVGQVNSLVDQLSSGQTETGSTSIQTVLDRGVERVNDLLILLPGGAEFHLDKQQVADTLKSTASSLVNSLADFITSAGSAFFGLISTSILAVFVISAVLKYQKELVSFIKNLSPFDDSINDLYLNRTATMTTAMVKGQFIIAAIQGTLSALSLWLVGIGYFWFFLTILIFLSFIPLGGGIVTITIGVILVLSGHIWPGLFLIMFHLLIVTNVDNLLRPRLVPESARLDTAVLLLAVFSGVAVFGAIGVVFGPVAMILLITALEIYIQYNAKRKRPALPRRS